MDEEVPHMVTREHLARRLFTQVQAAYTLFQDGRNSGLTKEGFRAQMHDKFAVVLSQKVRK